MISLSLEAIIHGLRSKPTATRAAGTTGTATISAIVRYTADAVRSSTALRSAPLQPGAAATKLRSAAATATKTFPALALDHAGHRRRAHRRRLCNLRHYDGERHWLPRAEGRSRRGRRPVLCRRPETGLHDGLFVSKP